MKTVQILAAAAIAAATFGAPALADPIDQALALAEPAQPADDAAPAKGRTKMDESRLGELSAGDSNTYQVLAGQQLTATSEGNTIQGDFEAGDVVFGEGALGAFSGIGNFVNNTGANSNLNGSIMVNIVGASVNQ
jgi:hypothetical protein